MKSRTSILLLATVLVAGAVRAEEKYDVLSVHKTQATFAGLKDHVCKGLTSACPHACGHSGSLAVFRIDAYSAYEKPGAFGDEKQTTFQFLVVDTRKNRKVPAELAATLETLEPGDKVVLEWEHRYMDRDGSRFPVRPVTKLEKLPAPGALPATPPSGSSR
jgi:hypothetical protein